MIKEIKQIAKLLKKAKKIALFTHINPDCDALGSTFGLYYALKQLNKKVDIYSKDPFTAVEKILFVVVLFPLPNSNVINRLIAVESELDIMENIVTKPPTAL